MTELGAFLRPDRAPDRRERGGGQKLHGKKENFCPPPPGLTGGFGRVFRERRGFWILFIKRKEEKLLSGDTTPLSGQKNSCQIRKIDV